jgi:protein-L-isoaspartate(D-aspartate) O-methyltransferase
MHWREEARRLAQLLFERGIRDERVLWAIANTPRHRFVPPELRDDAYLDIALPIGSGQTISQPFVVAFMTEALELRYWHDVLEVGTGSGYQAAILSRLCRQVCTIERYQNLYSSAKARLAQLGVRNVDARWGDGYEGVPEAAPFDRIIVTAAAEHVPPRLVEQLATGGVLVLPVGARHEEQSILRIRKTAEGLRSENLLPVRFVPMVEGQVP